MIDLKPSYPLNFIFLNKGLIKAFGYQAAAVIEAIAHELKYHPEKAREIYFTISIRFILNFAVLSADELIEAIQKLESEGIIVLDPDEPINEKDELRIFFNEEDFEI